MTKRFSVSTNDIGGIAILDTISNITIRTFTNKEYDKACQFANACNTQEGTIIRGYRKLLDDIRLELANESDIDQQHYLYNRIFEYSSILDNLEKALEHTEDTEDNTTPLYLEKADINLSKNKLRKAIKYNNTDGFTMAEKQIVRAVKYGTYISCVKQLRWLLENSDDVKVVNFGEDRRYKKEFIYKAVYFQFKLHGYTINTTTFKGSDLKAWEIKF